MSRSLFNDKKDLLVASAPLVSTGRNGPVLHMRFRKSLAHTLLVADDVPPPGPPSLPHYISEYPHHQPNHNFSGMRGPNQKNVCMRNPSQTCERPHNFENTAGRALLPVDSPPVARPEQPRSLSRRRMSFPFLRYSPFLPPSDATRPPIPHRPR